MTTLDTSPIFVGAAPLAPPPAKPKSIAAAMATALRQGQPGNWSSDHAAESQQFTSWDYIAIDFIANQAAQADVFCYGPEGGSPARQLRRKSFRAAGNRKAYEAETEGTALPIDHRLVRLLKRPSRFQSGASFRYEVILQLRLTGNCLIWNVPSKGGQVAERHVIPTAVAEPVQPTRDLPRGGWRIQPRTAYGSADLWAATGGYWRAVGQVIPAEQIEVIRKPHPVFKDDGYSPMSAASLEKDTQTQLSRARWGHLRHGVDPSAIIGLAEDVNQEEVTRYLTAVNQKYGGAENAGKVIGIPGVNGAWTLTTTPRDMAYELGWDQYRDFLLALHGMSKALIDAGSYASLYAALKQVTMLVVQPALDLYAEEETEQLAPYFGEGLTVEAIAAGVNDEELLERQLASETAAGGIRTRGEWRTLRGLPLFGDKRDEELAVPAPPPMQQFGQPPGQQAAKPEEKPGSNGEPTDPLDGILAGIAGAGAEKRNGNGNGKHLVTAGKRWKGYP